MKIKNFQILLLFFLVVFSTTAFALGHMVTFVFDEPSGIQDVSVEPFICNDASCSSLRDFPYSVQDSNKHDNKVTVRFPSKLKSQNGYALFFTAKDADGKDYAPLEIKSTTYGNAKSSVKSSKNPLFTFTKLPVCSAEISSFTIQSDGVNEPVNISAKGELSQSIKSFYNNLNPGIIAIPAVLSDFYSLNTQFSLEILNSSDDAIYTSDDSNFNMLFDDSESLSWSWTPTEEGTYTAKVYAKINDGKCSQANDITESKLFDISSSSDDQGLCYALISSLDIPTENIFENEDFRINLDWSSFLAEPQDNTLVKVEWFILNSSDEVVDSGVFYPTQSPAVQDIPAPDIADHFKGGCNTFG